MKWTGVHKRVHTLSHSPAVSPATKQKSLLLFNAVSRPMNSTNTTINVSNSGVIDNIAKEISFNNITFDAASYTYLTPKDNGDNEEFTVQIKQLSYLEVGLAWKLWDAGLLLAQWVHTFCYLFRCPSPPYLRN